MTRTLSLLTTLFLVLTLPHPVFADALETNSLLLNFRDVPLRAVLNYLSDKAGLIVVSEADVNGTVTVTASQQVSTDEAINLLNNELSRHHDTALLDGRTLTVMEAASARTNPLTPVATLTDPAQIPVNTRIITGILPVHSLNPEQLIKDLAPLIPAGDIVTANESGKALLITASQKNIRRLAAIVTALDSTALSEINVFPLNFADAKSVADELKELFQSADSDANGTAARISFGPRFGRVSGDGRTDDKDKTAPTRPVFLADEQMNAVAASAPPDYMPMITHVIQMLDKPGQDTTSVEIFPLLRADPMEIVDEITSLFATTPGTSTTAQPASRPAGFQFGNPGTLQSAASRPTTESARLKRQATVTAVADRRTQSVIVAASENMMAQIRRLIDKLDQSDKGVMRVSVIAGGFADPETISDALTVIFQSSSSSTSKQTQMNTPQTARPEAAATSAASAVTTSGTSGSTGTAGLH